MSASSDRARNELIREHQQRGAVRLTNQLVQVGHAAGLTDEQILDSVYDRRVRRSAERNLGMKTRSDATWQFVLGMLPGALSRAAAKTETNARAAAKTEANARREQAAVDPFSLMEV